jgi:hypothetical protein
MKSESSVVRSEPHAGTDLALAWALLLLGVARIAIAVVRREPGGVEVGLSTLVAVLSAIEIVRIGMRRRRLRREGHTH